MQYLVLSKPQICVFKIPQLSIGKGYQLGDWTEMIWEGSLKVFSENNVLRLKLVQNDKIFAETIVPQDYKSVIKKCEDSSRGFAVRLENNGKFAWVGCAFRERTDAFDFNVCFSDFYEKDNKVKDIKVQDFTFDRSKKITLNMDQKQNSENQNQIENKKFDFLPPTGNHQSSQPQNQKNINFDNNFSNDFSNFGQNQQSGTKFDQNFSDFSNFDNSGQNTNTKQQDQKNNLLEFDFGNSQKTDSKKQEFNLLDL